MKIYVLYQVSGKAQQKPPFKRDIEDVYKRQLLLIVGQSGTWVVLPLRTLSNRLEYRR